MGIRATRGEAILFWKVADGELVEEGQIVASLEQGKGSKAVMAPCGGTLHVACKGGIVDENQLLATIEQPAD